MERGAEKPDRASKWHTSLPFLVCWLIINHRSSPNFKQVRKCNSTTCPEGKKEPEYCWAALMTVPLPYHPHRTSEDLIGKLCEKIMQIKKNYRNISYRNIIQNVSIKKTRKHKWHSRLHVIDWGLKLFSGLAITWRAEAHTFLQSHISISRQISSLPHLAHLILSHVHIPTPQIN